MNQSSILLVAGGDASRYPLGQALEQAGYTCNRVENAGAALDLIARESVGLGIIESSPSLDGHALLCRIKHAYPELPVILLSANASVECAVEAMHAGAADYLTLPVETDRLLARIERHLVAPRMAQAEGPVVEDLRSREILELARRVARSEATVMLNGESGTGKEVFARYIHQHSERCNGPFIAINCAAIPENMLEAVLFGYEKGAFTGAYQSAPGKFEQAQGGILLLDEISEMSLPLQAKLLRVLQEKELERLGGRKLIELDVRVLATTNRVLREEVAAGRFREDLFYRLNVFPLTLPPLRERPRDILPLARYLLRKSLRPGQPAPEFSSEAKEKLLSYPWPGNVRELDNLIQRLLILHDAGEIGAELIRFEPVPEKASLAVAEKSAATCGRLPEDLRSVEEQLIIDALSDGRVQRKAVAARLGISERTLRYKIARMREAGVEIPGA